MFPFHKSAFCNRKSAMLPHSGVAGAATSAVTGELQRMFRAKDAKNAKGHHLCGLRVLGAKCLPSSFPASLMLFPKIRVLRVIRGFALFLVLVPLGFSRLACPGVAPRAAGKAPPTKRSGSCSLGGLGVLAVFFSYLPAFLIHPPKICVICAICGS